MSIAAAESEPGSRRERERKVSWSTPNRSGPLRLAGTTAAVIAAVVCGAAGAAAATARAAPTRAPRWRPPARVTWYWQLQGRLRLPEPGVEVVDLDGLTTSAATVARLHRGGERAVCYVDVGTWERWRPDARRFPRALIGAPNGWPGERWLDVAHPAALEPIVAARLEMCARKRFDAVEPDNIDGYENRTGFRITAAQQLRFDRWVARRTHALGLAVLQKNDPEQAAALEPSFDGALAEQCVQFSECGRYRPYLRAGKPVLDAEYRPAVFGRMCAVTGPLGIAAVGYDLALDGRRFEPCRDHG